jgi:hypothetical protein
MVNFPWVAQLKQIDGKLHPYVRDREQFYNWLSSQFKDGDKVWIRVTKPSRSRTHEQFKYLYSCVYPFIAEYVGCDVDTVDGIMKKRHLTVNIDTPLEYVKNKTDLDRAELAKFIDDVRTDAAGMGIETQDPVGDD